LVLAPELRCTASQRVLVLGAAVIEELRRDLREVTRRIQPDWDLSDPQLKAAWKAGDKSRFWRTGSRCGSCLGGVISHAVARSRRATTTGLPAGAYAIA